MEAKRRYLFLIPVLFMSSTAIAETEPGSLQKSFEVLLATPDANLLEPSFSIDTTTGDAVVAATPVSRSYHSPSSCLLWRVNTKTNVSVVGHGGPLGSAIPQFIQGARDLSMESLVDKSSDLQLLQYGDRLRAVVHLSDKSYRFVQFDGATVSTFTSLFAISRNVKVSKTVSLNNGGFLTFGREGSKLIMNSQESNGSKLWERVIPSKASDFMMDFNATEDGRPLLIRHIGVGGALPSLDSHLQVDLYDASGQNPKSCEVNGTYGSIVQGDGKGFACVYTHGDLTSQEITFVQLDESLKILTSNIVGRDRGAAEPFILRKIKENRYIMASCTDRGIILQLLDSHGNTIDAYTEKLTYNHTMVNDVRVVGNKVYLITLGYGSPEVTLPGTGIGLICFTVTSK